LWLIQFALSPVEPSPSFWGTLAGHIHTYVTIAYLVWAAVEIIRMIVGWRKPIAFTAFADIWKKHVRRRVSQ